MANLPIKDFLFNRHQRFSQQKNIGTKSEILQCENEVSKFKNVVIKAAAIFTSFRAGPCLT